MIDATDDTGDFGMAPSVADLGIDRLSVDDRIAFDRAICRELERRLADHAANPSDVVLWEHIRSEALARWKASPR